MFFSKQGLWKEARKGSVSRELQGFAIERD